MTDVEEDPRKAAYMNAVDRTGGDLLRALAQQAMALVEREKVQGDVRAPDDVRWNAARAYREAEAASARAVEEVLKVHLDYVRPGASTG